jgi:tRNA-dihydrouridine synthase
MCDYDLFSQLDAEEIDNRAEICADYFELMWNYCLENNRYKEMDQIFFSQLRGMNVPSNVDSLKQLFGLEDY